MRQLMIKHGVWIGLVLLGLVVSGVFSVRLIDTVATVVVICALIVGYFVEANALVDLAPRRFTLFAPLAGAVLGALVGLLNHGGKWFVGYDGADVENVPVWTIGGGIVGALLGLLVVDRFVRSEARTPRTYLIAAVVGAAVGAPIGGLNHMMEWFIGQDGIDVTVPLWPLGGAVVGALLGRFVWASPRLYFLYAMVKGALVGVVVAGLGAAVLAALVAAVASSAGWVSDGSDWPAVAFVAGAVIGGIGGAVLGFRLWAKRPPEPMRIPDRARPAIFLAPALLFLGITLLVPTLRTIYLSFRSADSEQAVGGRNYRQIFESDAIFTLDGLGDVFTSRLFLAGVLIGGVALLLVILRGSSSRRGVDMSAPLPVISLTGTAILVLLAMVGSLHGVIWNNVFWIAFVTALSTIFGLTIAVLADRSRGETVAKALIFMPMAISFVGASIIWRFVYFWSASGDQIGLLNAIWVGLGGTAQTWIGTRPWNDLFLIAIMIWIQTGFAMVVLSSAIKGVPTELLEAARVDGASEGQTFWRITVPHIRSTIAVVVTTLVITVLKVYDIVKVMTDGEFDTNVIANQMFNQAFLNNDYGLGSALAVVLFIAVVPIMIVNVRRLRQAEAEAR